MTTLPGVGYRPQVDREPEWPGGRDIFYCLRGVRRESSDRRYKTALLFSPTLADVSALGSWSGPPFSGAGFWLLEHPHW